jgi:pimeloyl-ACP methyl ester carboxylesterase
MSLIHVRNAEIAFETLGYAGPVIVFESGLGGDMRSWNAVTRPLAAFARLVLYERPGIGRRAGLESLLTGSLIAFLQQSLS